MLLSTRNLYNFLVIQPPDRNCSHRENLYSATTRLEKIFSLGSLSMSNPVLFPVAMCSPVRPFPSCPFSPLPQAYTVNRRQPLIQALHKKCSSRALSVHGEEKRECNASRGGNDALLFASLRVERSIHKLECVNF